MKRFLVLAALAAACGGVTDGKPGSGSDRLNNCPDCSDPSPNPGSPPTDPAPNPAPTPAPSPAPTTHPTPAPPQGFAILERDMPPYNPPGGGASGSGGSGGAGLDPMTLHLAIGTSGASCANPREISDCEEWAVRIPLPADLQHEGTIPLSRVNAFMSSGGERRSPDPYDCGMGGGSFSQGYLSILQIDDQKVRFTLTDTWTFDFNANGSYEVERCPIR